MKKTFTLLAFLCAFYFSTTAQSNALSFDGTDDYVRVATPYQDFGSTNQITVEWWVNFQGPVTTQPGIGQTKENSSDPATSVFLMHPYADNSIAFFVYKSGGFTSARSTPVAPGWHHIAGTADASSVKIYVDGVLAASSANTGVQSGTDNILFIGKEPRGFNTHFRGYIDEVRIWNVARTAEQIKQNMFGGVPANSPGLVEYYKFDEASGETVTDSSPTGAHGTLGTDATETAQNPTRIASPIQSAPNGLSFDGADDHVNIGAGFNYQTFTIEMWVKPGATQGAFADIIDNNHGSGINWVLQQNGGNQNQYVFGSNGTASAPINLTANVWQHLAIVVGGGTKTVYLNGSVVSNETGLGPINYNGNEFVRLGQWGGGGRNWNGMMDEVRFWNVARTQTEIQNFMSAGLRGTEAGLVALYNFNEGVADGNNTGLTVLPNIANSTFNNGTLTNFALTGTTSNFVAGAPGITPLSVNLTSFAAAKHNGVVQLSWSTVNEQNVVSFEVERSANGRSFTSLGSVKAAGNANRYSFTDAQPLSPVNYYRLRTTSANGKESLSAIVSVKMNSHARLEVYPNPVTDVLQLQTAATGKIDVAIYNGAGVLVKRMILSATSGITTLPVDVRNFSKGLYLLQLHSATGTERTNFIKQ